MSNISQKCAIFEHTRESFIWRSSTFFCEIKFQKFFIHLSNKLDISLKDICHLFEPGPFLDNTMKINGTSWSINKFNLSIQPISGWEVKSSCIWRLKKYSGEMQKFQAEKRQILWRHDSDEGDNNSSIVPSGFDDLMGRWRIGFHCRPDEVCRVFCFAS